MEYENTPAESDPKRPSVSEINEVFAQDLDAQKFSDDLVFDFPEGGRRAWMAVAGAFLCLFVGGVVCPTEHILLTGRRADRKLHDRNTVSVSSLLTTQLTS